MRGAINAAVTSESAVACHPSMGRRDIIMIGLITLFALVDDEHGDMVSN